MSIFGKNILTDWRYTRTRSWSRIRRTASLVFIEVMPVWGCNEKSYRCSSTRSNSRLQGWMAVEQYLNNRVAGIKQDLWSVVLAKTKENYNAPGAPGMISFGCCECVIVQSNTAVSWLHRNPVVRTRTRFKDRFDAYRLCLEQVCQLLIVLQKQEIPKLRHYMQSILSVLSGGMSTRPSGE